MRLTNHGEREIAERSGDYLALKDVCRVDDATADKVVASNVDAILGRLLPTTPTNKVDSAMRKGNPEEGSGGNQSRSPTCNRSRFP